MKNNIASERMKVGLKQADLARELDVSLKSLARWERGEFPPQARVLIRMHELFGCTVDYLLGLTEERT